MELPYTAAAVAAVLIILQQALMMNAGKYRGKVSIGVGVGQDKELERKVRRHGNLAENAAIFLVVLTLAEGIFGTNMFLMVVATIFVLARFSHALAFTSIAGSHGVVDSSKAYLMLRMFGALGSALGGIGLGLYLIFRLVS